MQEGSEGWNIFGCSLPHNGKFNNHVVVDKFIPHACHSPPRYCRVGLTHTFWNTLCCLTNNLKCANDSEYGFVIVAKLSFIEILDKDTNLIHSLNHIGKITQKRTWCRHMLIVSA